MMIQSYKFPQRTTLLGNNSALRLIDSNFPQKPDSRKTVKKLFFCLFLSSNFLLLSKK